MLPSLLHSPCSLQFLLPLPLLPVADAGDGAVTGLHLSAGLDPATFLRGRLDLRCVAAAGHRWALGATPTMLVAPAGLQCSAAQSSAVRCSWGAGGFSLLGR